MPTRQRANWEQEFNSLPEFFGVLIGPFLGLAWNPIDSILIEILFGVIFEIPFEVLEPKKIFETLNQAFR